jgi:glycosyltransferase involved in cell wall biosynthesis
MKSNISVILPVHQLTPETEGLFANAVKSIENQIVRPEELIIVTSKYAQSQVESFNYGEIKDIVKIVVNEDKTDFCSQMNLGVENVKSEWFSMIELDDEMSKIWLKNVVEYRAVYGDIGMFLPIIVDVDINGGFIDLTNQPVWASEFSDEMGVLDMQALLTYQNFNFDGMVMKKSLYQELGGLKPSIQLTFVYEFLLRMVFNDTKVMVIPRLGYKHVNQRPGSLFHQYNDTLTKEEAIWWMNQAKKEYYFIDERKITQPVLNN